MVSTNDVQITRTTTRSTLFSRNHPTLLLIKKRRSTDATGGLLSKISQYSQENKWVEVSFKLKRFVFQLY